MDFTSHALTQRRVYHLMTRDRSLAGKLRSHDDSLEMRVIVAAHMHFGLRQALPDKLLYFGW